jgi:short-subunit dehydrogenase
MKLADARVLITGASGGIGAAFVRELIARGGKALITGRDEASLRDLARSLDPDGERMLVVAADITRADDRRRLCEAARRWRGGVNVLINNAGVAAFSMFTDERSEDLEHAFAVNALAPLHLCSALLPHLKRQPHAQIVNVGSVFGAIAYPGHAVYSATKFALRGFSEALRRELADTNVRVHYLAPRATRTKFNCGAIEELNARLGIAMDPPERVAASLCRMLEKEEAERVIGWPEKLFARINAILPRVVDRSLAKQLPAIRRHAATPHPAASPPIESLSRKIS